MGFMMFFFIHWYFLFDFVKMSVHHLLSSSLQLLKPLNAKICDQLQINRHKRCQALTSRLADFDMVHCVRTDMTAQPTVQTVGSAQCTCETRESSTYVIDYSTCVSSDIWNLYSYKQFVGVRQSMP